MCLFLVVLLLHRPFHHLQYANVCMCVCLLMWEMWELASVTKSQLSILNLFSMKWFREGRVGENKEIELQLYKWGLLSYMQLDVIWSSDVAVLSFSLLLSGGILATSVHSDVMSLVRTAITIKCAFPHKQTFFSNVFAELRFIFFSKERIKKTKNKKQQYRHNINKTSSQLNIYLSQKLE